MVCPPVRALIHSLKLVDFPLVQEDKPRYNYYVFVGYYLIPILK